VGNGVGVGTGVGVGAGGGDGQLAAPRVMDTGEGVTALLLTVSVADVPVETQPEAVTALASSDADSGGLDPLGAVRQIEKAPVDGSTVTAAGAPAFGDDTVPLTMPAGSGETVPLAPVVPEEQPLDPVSTGAAGRRARAWLATIRTARSCPGNSPEALRAATQATLRSPAVQS
jgi:hypothetical protein